MAKAVILLAILSAVVLSASPLVSGYRGMLVGGRTEVKDVKSNEEVQELGRFCVKEFNKQQLRSGSNGGELMFSEVVAAETQVVSGIKYYLKIEASDMNGLVKVFDSVVVVKAWVNDKQLIAFEPSVLVMS
ncbi:cysteine proteinase inhibitor B [Mercurialis annua]|uniref:cysteine proteinase inhibitor B n=1 Tax=Mercurialis annua TaxID=3986 RepID=UPI00215E52AE|nr:cysteine proteinase inhibitor B [Mercurialis annua]